MGERSSRAEQLKMPQAIEDPSVISHVDKTPDEERNPMRKNETGSEEEDEVECSGDALCKIDGLDKSWL